LETKPKDNEGAERKNSNLPPNLVSGGEGTGDRENEGAGLRREGAEQNPIFPPNYTSGADENEEMELHQTLISHETETSKQK